MAGGQLVSSQPAISYAKYEAFSEASQGNYTLKGFKETIIESLRLVKQPAELELLRRAIAITDQTLHTSLCMDSARDDRKSHCMGNLEHYDLAGSRWAVI